jgi:hypothetical protein
LESIIFIMEVTIVNKKILQLNFSPLIKVWFSYTHMLRKCHHCSSTIGRKSISIDKNKCKKPAIQLLKNIISKDIDLFRFIWFFWGCVSISHGPSHLQGGQDFPRYQLKLIQILWQNITANTDLGQSVA